MLEHQDFLESVDTFKVSFGGESSIDAELFARMIQHTTVLVKESAKAINPDCFLRLEIKTNQEGSFETILDAVAKVQSDLFTRDNARLAGEIIVGFLAFLQIKEHFRGQKVKKIKENGKKKIIYNKDNQPLEIDSRIADHFFENSHIENTMINIFNDLKENKRDSFSVHQKNGSRIIFKEDSYEEMTEKIVEKTSQSKLEKQEPVEVILLLKKPDLLGYSSWQFVYNKNISAKIEDEEFLEKVHKGKIRNLYAGVKIPCLMRIEYELDNHFQPIPNSDRYVILKITGPIIEPV